MGVGNFIYSLRKSTTEREGGANLKGEVRVKLVVAEDVPDHLVEHGEEGAESSQASEVHDVVLPLGVLEATRHQTIGREIGAQ